jgi:hypothetical protein
LGEGDYSVTFDESEWNEAENIVDILDSIEE